MTEGNRPRSFAYLPVEFVLQRSIGQVRVDQAVQSGFYRETQQLQNVDVAAPAGTDQLWFANGIRAAQKDTFLSRNKSLD